MKTLVTGEIVFGLSGFEGVVCMKRDVRELGRPYRLLCREEIGIYGMRSLRHIKRNLETTWLDT
jgi:hypothetical protein